MLPPPLEISTDQQNRTPHKPPAQPCRSPQCSPHHLCCTLQRLQLTLQCPLRSPGLASHTLAGLCVLWLPSAQPCRSPQCRIYQLFYTLQWLHLTLQCPMACPGLVTNTMAGLCALWLLNAASSSGNLHKPAKPHPQRTTCTTPLPPPPAQDPPPLLLAAEA